jgi:site-specific recombinase XerD
VDKLPRPKRTHETQAGLRLTRAKAIVFLMQYTGPRIEEVERLTLEDVELHPKSGVLHIWQGKGFRERDVPLLKPSLDNTLPQSQVIMSLER